MSIEKRHLFAFKGEFSKWLRLGLLVVSILALFQSAKPVLAYENSVSIKLLRGDSANNALGTMNDFDLVQLAQDPVLVNPTVDYLVRESEKLSVEAKNAIAFALREWKYSLPANGRFSVLSLRIEENWILGTVSSANLVSFSSSDLPVLDGDMVSLVVVKHQSGWIAAIEGGSNLDYVLDLIPDSELGVDAKGALFFSNSQATSQQTYNQYKFPWPSDRPWHNHGGWHGTSYLALDWDVVDNTNSDVLSAAPGYITNLIACSPSDHYILRITTQNTSEKLSYIHLSGESVRALGLKQGDFVYQGRKLGVMAGAFELGGDTCGIKSTGTHLHFEFPFRPFIIEGKAFSVNNWYDGVNLYSTNNDNGGGGGQSACKTYSFNGIVLFDGQQCTGNKLSYSSATGLVSLPPLGWNDRARSIHVGSGWSVKTYQHDPPGSGASRCINGSMWDLAQDKFDGNVVVMDKEISSIQVFNNTSCNGGPAAGEVKLYSLANYQNQVWQGGTGFSNGPGGNAYSMSIPSGWSVKTWRQDNKGGGDERCWSSSVPNLQDHGWQNAIQSIEVFSSNVCPVIPSAPGLISPANGTTTGRYDNVVLSWNSASNATQYYAEFWGDSGLSVNSGWTSNLSFTVGNSFWGGTYQWRVKSKSSSGTESGWSETRTLYRKYGTPSSLSASAVSQNQVNLSWAASADAPGNITGYRIYRNGVSIGTVGASTTSYSDTGGTCNTGYSYVVRAYKGGLESDASNTASATTSACGPGVPTLSNPANDATIGRFDNITLYWNTASNATQYYAEFWGGPGLNLNSGWTGNTSWFIGSQWGGVYQWRVKSRNSSGVESGWSETRKLTILYGTPPNLTASVVSGTQINLSWGASADAPGNIDGYRIYRNGTALTTIGSSTTSYQDTGIVCGSTYSYTVRAYKGSLESNASNTVSATPTACPPAAPSNVTISGSTQTSITLSWSDNSTNESGFKIYRWSYVQATAQWAFVQIATVGANITTYTQSGLTCGNDFNFYEVSAYNANGESAHTPWVQGVTAECPKPELKITAVYVYPQTLYANSNIFVEILVLNDSDVNAANFWIDLYVDDAPAGCSDWGSAWVLGGPLEAHQTESWFITIPADTVSAGTRQLNIFVDSGCQIAETNETNNTAGKTISVVAPPAAPSHNDFNSARLISTTPYTHTVSVLGATRASDDPAAQGCGLKPGLASVWYKFTPSINRKITLDTIGSNYDTYIAVWKGTRGSLVEVGCNDDVDYGAGNIQSSLTVDLSAGVTYYIQIAEFDGSISTSAQAQGEREAMLPLFTEPDAQSVSTKQTADVVSLAGGTLVLNVKPAPRFADVPVTFWSWQHIESLYAAGITTGCGGGNYCPGNTVTRDQMAVFLMRGIKSSGYTPPAVGTSTGFADVPTTFWAAAWIKQFALEGITAGCGGGNYCPSSPVTRDQMAVFLLRAKYGALYLPPPVGGSTGFADVPTSYWAAAWIKQLAAEGITTGCGGGNFCPSTPVSRDQMAVFLQRTFNLPLP